jgi:hypothetical protein
MYIYIQFRLVSIWWLVCLLVCVQRRHDVHQLALVRGSHISAFIHVNGYAPLLAERISFVCLCLRRSDMTSTIRPADKKNMPDPIEATGLTLLSSCCWRSVCSSAGPWFLPKPGCPAIMRPVTACATPETAPAAIAAAAICAGVIEQPRGDDRGDPIVCWVEGRGCLLGRWGIPARLHCSIIDIVGSTRGGVDLLTPAWGGVDLLASACGQITEEAHRRKVATLKRPCAAYIPHYIRNAKGRCLDVSLRHCVSAVPRKKKIETIPFHAHLK